MKKFFGTAILLLSAILLTSVTALADVNIFAEGAYTDTDLVVYIYADTTVNTPTELRSAGVKLTYNPTELTNPSAEKNETDWYLGSESYMDPDTSTEGEVIFILGKLNTEDTSEGVSGNRVLLGKATFTHTGLTNFNIGLEYGKRGEESPPGSGLYSFKNFVDIDANALDDTGAMNFGTITVRKRGDASEDGDVDGRDIRALRTLIGTPNLPCWCDGNGDEEVDGRDIRWLRQNI